MSKNIISFVIGIVVLMAAIMMTKEYRSDTQSAFAPGIAPDFTYEFKPVIALDEEVFMNAPLSIGNEEFTSSPLNFSCKSVGYRSPPQGTKYYSNCQCTKISSATGNCLDQTYDAVEVPVDPSCWTANVSYDAMPANILKTGDEWQINPYIHLNYIAEGLYFGNDGCYLTQKEPPTPAGFEDDGTAWANRYAFNIDVVNGIDTFFMPEESALVELSSEPKNLTVIVENRIADGLNGGVFVTTTQKGFFTGEKISRTDHILSLGNNTFQIDVPRDELGLTEISLLGFVQVDVPYVNTEGEISFNPWIGTDDAKTTAQYEVLKRDQFSQYASKTLVPYKSPYKRESSFAGEIKKPSSSRYFAIGGLAALATLIAVIFIRRNK